MYIYKHFFDSGLYSLNGFTAHVTFGLVFSAFKFQFSMIVSLLLLLSELLWLAYFFQNVFSLIPL